MSIVSIKHNNIDIVEMSLNGTALLLCEEKYISDNLSATLTLPLNYEGQGYITATKPANLSIIKTITGSKITNEYSCPIGVNMTGDDRGVLSGVYTATYTLKEGYYWEDLTRNPITVTLTIVDVPINFTANTANSTILLLPHGTHSFNQNFLTSVDMINWTDFIPGSTTITLTNVGDKVYFKGNNPNGVNESWDDRYQFVMTGSIAASGNIMSLIDNGLCTCTSIPNNYCFFQLFRECAALTAAPNLPATVLSSSCYSYMFLYCSGLLNVPSLSKSIMADSSCYAMFWGCTSLTSPPALPSTTLAPYCYEWMFSDCTSLASVPELPANYIVTSAYSQMFYGCSSLQVSSAQTAEAPYLWRLPALGFFTNPDTVYGSLMYYGCLGTRTSDHFAAYPDGSENNHTQNMPIS